MRLIIDILAGLLVAVSLWATAPRAHAQQPVVPYGQTANVRSAVEWHPLVLSGLGATVTSVKARAGRLAFIYCYNPTGAVAYLQLFDAATPGAVTLGSTTPKLSLGIPSIQAAGLGPATIGVSFLQGIQAASTTTATGSTGASQDCNVAYN